MTTTTGTQSVSSGSPESWELAKKQASLLGGIPSSFTVVIRALVHDQATNKGRLRPVNKFQVARLLRGPSFKGMLYHAIKALRPESLEGQKDWNVGSMMAVFEPLDLAALIASYVYYRKCRKVTPDHHWGIFALALTNEPQLGASVGAAIKSIGVGVGLLSSTFQHYARCSFALKFSDAYARFRETDQQLGAAQLVKLEESLFGCSSGQVAVMILSAAGFTSDIGTGLATALDPSRPTAFLKDEYASRVRHARIWIDAARQGLMQPNEKIDARFFPDQGQFEWLKVSLAEIMNGRIGWLQRTKSEINATNCPELFAKTSITADIPEALRDVFSMEEITNMEEEDFDDLIDQIDEEQASGKHPEVLDGKDLSAIENMMAEDS